MTKPTMTEMQRKMARHALGLEGKLKRSYRNRYFAPVGTPAFIEWEKMVVAGWAVRETQAPRPSGALFWLTREGAEHVLARGEILCKEDFPT